MFLAHVPAGMGFSGVSGPPITAPPQSRSRVVESRGRFASTSARLFTVVDGNRAVVGLRGMMVCGYGRPWISIHGCGGGRQWGSREDRNPAAVFRAAVNGYKYSKMLTRCGRLGPMRPKAWTTRRRRRSRTAGVAGRPACLPAHDPAPPDQRNSHAAQRQQGQRRRLRDGKVINSKRAGGG